MAPAICEKLISMMDGDIAVETEPGMGSRFTIRIPLYGVQNTSPVSRDGFAGKTCWLAIHNTSLAMFVTSLLSYHGLTVRRRQAGETPDAEDVLLTDDEALSGWQGRAMVIFCRRHIGIPAGAVRRRMAAQRDDSPRTAAAAGRVFSMLRSPVRGK